MLRRWILAIGFLLVNAVALRTTAYAADCPNVLNAPGCSFGLPAEKYQELLGLMGAHPGPNVRQLPVDEANVIKYSDTRSKPARMASRFSGVLFDAPPALPTGWVLKTTRPNLLPRWMSPHPDHYVGRYTRVYIYGSVRNDGMDWYLIGPGQWLAKTAVARLVVPNNPGVGGKWVAVDVRQQVLTAFENDRLVYATLISSGKGQRYTRLGLRPIYLRQYTGDMSRLMGDADDYNIYDVPFVMYFNSGMALHGASWHDNFGAPMSHGCVNMAITDAHWMWDWTQDAPNAPVYVWRS